MRIILSDIDLGHVVSYQIRLHSCAVSGLIRLPVSLLTQCRVTIDTVKVCHMLQSKASPPAGVSRESIPAADPGT